MRTPKLVFLLVLALAVLFAEANRVHGGGKTAPPTPQQVRIVGPDVMQAGTRNLVTAEGLFEGKTWKALDPDYFKVQVAGAGRLVDDPAAKPMNPFEVRADDSTEKVVIDLQAAGRAASRSFPVGTAKPAGTFEATVNPLTVTHRFSGLGGGVLFYDNQFDITAGDDIYDWCFRDVRTTFLHVLIRPNYEKENDNDDARNLDLAKYDFSASQRPFRIIKKALERNPEFKIYASLYSPPAWMKTNNSTSGVGSLKDGPRFRQELAEYVFAYLKHAHAQGIPVHYLGLFNEPDFPHSQEGMHFPDMGVLVETFAETTKALDALIAKDPEMKKGPIYVFPDTLGPGSITRGGKNAKKLMERAQLLDRVGVWGVHDYWNQSGTYWKDRYRELRAFPAVGKRPIWMTEWAQRDRRGDLASGVEYGVTMLNALRLGAEAWMVFEWCHPSGNQSGLISTDWGAKAPRERYWRSKAYHVFRQIANTSPPGAQVVAMTGRWKGASVKTANVETLALRDGADVIVHLMNAEPAPISFQVNVRGQVDKVVGWWTTPLADMQAAAEADLSVGRQGEMSRVSGIATGNSLLTFVLKGGR